MRSMCNVEYANDEYVIDNVITHNFVKESYYNDDYDKDIIEYENRKQFEEDDKNSEKFLSPKYDFVFKYLFGNEKNKDILQAFLSDVLTLDDDELVDIQLKDTHNNKEHKDDKLTIFDVRAMTKSGTSIDIEIQYSTVASMTKRVVYYTCRMFSDQLKEGKDYENVHKAITIVITDFEFLKKDNYHGRYRFHDNMNHDTLTDLIEIHTLELPKVPEHQDDEVWSWMKFINSKTEEEFSMLAENNNKIKKAVTELEKISSDKAARYAAWNEEKDRRDREAIILAGIQKGVAEGMAKATAEVTAKVKAEVTAKVKAEVTAKVKAEVTAKVKAESRVEMAIEIAKRLKNSGMEMQSIIDATNLTESEINKI